MLQDGGTADGRANTVGEAQGGSGRIVKGETRLLGQPGQVEVPAELMQDVSAHGFWKRGTTTTFDVRIVNFDSGSHLRMNPGNTLEKAEN